MATKLLLQQSARKLQAVEADLRALESASPRSRAGGRTPPRAHSPAKRGREWAQERAAARLEVDLVLHQTQVDSEEKRTVASLLAKMFTFLLGCARAALRRASEARPQQAPDSRAPPQP